MYSIKTAIILAAGLGLRLRDTFSGRPKGLLSIDGTSLIERSIQQLIEHGINDIVLVTGYLAHDYESIANTNQFVRVVHNPLYADSGSMYSLYCARHAIHDHFLLLESDLLYESRALCTLLNSPLDSAILASGFTQSGDEVYIEAKDNYLYHISKQPNDLQKVVGELVGISKISRSLFKKMLTYSEHYFQKSLHLNYEDGCLNQVAKQTQIPICLVPDLLWAEIDNATHLHRAESVIWPQITE